MTHNKRDMVMICIAYPLVVAVGAFLLTDHETVLIGVAQIFLGLALMGWRIIR